MDPQFPEDVETVFPREHHVEQNEVQGREVQGGRQSRVAVVGGEDFESLGLQVVRQQVAELPVVVEQKKGMHGHRLLSCMNRPGQ